MVEHPTAEVPVYGRKSEQGATFARGAIARMRAEFKKIASGVERNRNSGIYGE